MNSYERGRVRRSIISICAVVAWTTLMFAAAVPLTRPAVPSWATGLAFGLWVIVGWNLVWRLPHWRMPPIAEDQEPLSDELPELD
jgi:hypothetical protein